MRIDDSFFDAEMVDGFYIRSMVKRAWGAQLNVLKKIDDICKKYNINYYAEYGTLLGAIRHHGFIPWDDDMDIGMLRRDYEIFMKQVRFELPEGYKVIDIYEYPEYDELITRIVNTSSINTSQSFLEQNCGCPYSVGIDLFICDNIPDDENEREVHRQLFYAVWCLAQGWNNPALDKEEKEESLKQICEITGVTIDKKKSVSHQLFVLSDQIAGMYKNTATKEVAIMGSFAKDATKHIPRGDVEKTILMPFEMIDIPVPINYDNFLNHRYKNYKIPQKKSKGHKYPFFREQEMLLGKMYHQEGITIPDSFDYVYSRKREEYSGILYNGSCFLENHFSEKMMIEIRIEDIPSYFHRGSAIPLIGLRISAGYLLLIGMEPVAQIAHSLGAKYVLVEMNSSSNLNFDEIIIKESNSLRKDTLTWFLENGCEKKEDGTFIQTEFYEEKNLKRTVERYNMYCGRECFEICVNIPILKKLNIEPIPFLHYLSDNIGLVHLDLTEPTENILAELKRIGYCDGIIYEVPDVFCTMEKFEQMRVLEKMCINLKKIGGEK